MKMLAVHPNYELYGSDRAFAAALGAVRERLPGCAITVLLPRTGPLLDLPVFREVRVWIEDFWVARRRDLAPRRLPGFLAGGLRHLAAARRRMRGFDLVYIDTIVCLDHILAARFTRVPTLIHVHEIPLGAEMRVFRRMLLWSRATIAFNSAATRDAFALPAHVPQLLVYNGTADQPDSQPSDYDGGRPLRLLLIGRISFWKGQDVLVAALAAMGRAAGRVEVRIVGDTFDGHPIRAELDARIATGGLADTVAFQPFAEDPAPAYRWADVVVVPSTRPEPFGRVAIEGMAHARAVIASNHGGLVESVEDGVTGRLVTPSDAAALAAAITGYLDAPALVAAHGTAGRARFRERFTDEASDSAFVAAIDRVMSGRTGHPGG